MRFRSLLTPLALLFCAGCNVGALLANILTNSHLGAIFPDPVSVFPMTPTNAAAPDTVTHGVPFTVTVDTHGNKCLKGMDRTAVAYPARDTAVVQPYDLVESGTCGDALLILHHATSVTFANPGRATVRFEGVLAQDNNAPVIVIRSVIVR